MVRAYLKIATAPIAIAITPPARAKSLGHGASRSAVMTTVTTAIAARSITPMAISAAIGGTQHANANRAMLEYLGYDADSGLTGTLAELSDELR